ncbi:type II secretion system protein [Blastomonas sp. CACIA14H2]|uniref:type II secretion system protein n=1 Tax=Blastomonas sp. CACIA14H2 TaxID=1419876 RepID=UPI00269FD50C
MVPTRSQSGFSLVELSIVLVILGLLTGGILAGQSLIRAAELRAVPTEYNRWITATRTFQDKYFALPGDMTNASGFWGAFDGNDGRNADCRAEQPAIATCNGNGDGQIEPLNNSVNTYETYLFWKHLENAGLIEGKYTGSPTNFAGNSICATTTAYLAGCNMPKSRFDNNGAWLALYRGNLIGDPYLFDGTYNHILMLLAGTNAPLDPNSPLMRAEELWNIDSKIDDGRPASGKVVAGRWNICSTGAANTASGANATYALTSSNKNCMPVFREVF